MGIVPVCRRYLSGSAVPSPEDGVHGASAVERGYIWFSRVIMLMYDSLGNKDVLHLSHSAAFQYLTSIFMHNGHDSFRRCCSEVAQFC